MTRSPSPIARASSSTLRHLDGHGGAVGELDGDLHLGAEADDALDARRGDGGLAVDLRERDVVGADVGVDGAVGRAGRRRRRCRRPSCPTVTRPLVHVAAQHVGAAHERGDEGARGAIVDVVGRAGLRDAALVHDDDVVGDLHGLLLIVRHEQRRDVAPVVEAAQPLAQLDAHLGVERAERLVEQQQLGLDREGAREGDALALAARELRRVALAEAVELHEREQLVDLACAPRPWAPCARSCRRRCCGARSCA